jgi:cytochrome c oxidase assembly protein subunit 15
VVAVLHNAGAALLVLLVTMLNYKVQHQLDRTRPVPQFQSAASASHP